MTDHDDAPLALPPRAAAARLGISRRSLDRAIARGEVRAVRIGARVLVPLAELHRVLGVDAPAPSPAPASICTAGGRER